MLFPRLDVPTKHSLVRQVFHKLIRVIQTELEHKRVTNGTPAELPVGDLVYAASGDRVVGLAVDTSAATADWVGVVEEPIAAGERGIIRTEGYTRVRMLVTDTPVAGDQVYVSAAPGAGTVTAPGVGDFQKLVGVVGDASDFDAVDYPFVSVFLQRCCAPVPLEQ